MQITRIDNKGDIPLILTHNGDKYEIPVGGSKIVPYECAASAFGDPRAQDSGRDRGRTDVYNSTRGMWNFEVGFDTAVEWEEKRPKFESFDVNTGEQIWFVIDDPTGEKAYNPADTATPVNGDSAQIASVLTAMQAQIAQLTAALALSQNSTSGLDIGAPEVVAPAEAPVAAPVVTATQELPKLPDSPAKVIKDGPRNVARGNP